MHGADHTGGGGTGGDGLPDGPRWVHPSEIGLRRRVRADRRRSYVLATGVMVAGLAVLGVTSHLPAGAPLLRHVGGSSSPMSSAVVAVDPLRAGAAPTTGLVVDDDGHVVVQLSAMGPSTVARVSCGGHVHDAAVVAVDTAGGIVVLAVDPPDDSAPLPTTVVREGQQLTLTSVGGDGDRRAAQVSVTAITGDRAAEFEAEGTSRSQGVLSTADGRVAGWVTGEPAGGRDGSVAALSAVTLAREVRSLLSSGDGAS